MSQSARGVGPRSTSRATLGGGVGGGSGDGNSAASTASSATGGLSRSSFFIKERERLVTDIADGMEQLLGNVNTLNRKLEESITVGQEFGPIANLWGPFMEMLTGHGLTATNSPAAAASTSSEPSSNANTRQSLQQQQQQQAADNIDYRTNPASIDGANTNRLPPGVAPGGGTVYGMSGQ